MRHPDQQLITIDNVQRYKKNSIVEFLLEESSFDLNTLNIFKSFPVEDWRQFYQLIGVSSQLFDDLMSDTMEAME